MIGVFCQGLTVMRLWRHHYCSSSLKQVAVGYCRMADMAWPIQNRNNPHGSTGTHRTFFLLLIPSNRELLVIAVSCALLRAQVVVGLQGFQAGLCGLRLLVHAMDHACVLVCLSQCHALLTIQHTHMAWEAQTLPSPVHA